MLIVLLSCTPDPVDTAAPDTTPPVDTATPTDSDTPPDTESPPDTGKDTGKSGDTGDTGEKKEEWGWRSDLYPADWTPGFAVDEHFLHDFSYAGYHNGEDDLTVPADATRYTVTDYGADATGASDATDAIQSAIDAAAEAGGGVVYLPAGEYRCDGLLTVAASNVHVVGDGVGKTKLYFTLGEDVTDTHHLTFSGTLSEDTESLLTEDGASLSHTVTVADATGFAVGDDVSVGWVITEDFIADHGMTDTWAVSNDKWRPFFRRNITAIDGNTLTLDVPLRYPALTRDEASIRLESGFVSECSVSALSISTVVEWEDAWSNDRSHAIAMSGVKDCWVSDVESYESPNSSDDRGSHLQSGGVIVVHSKRVTVADSTMENAQHRGDGGNGYLFEVTRSSDVLFVDLTARAGRHNFIQNWDFGASGVVWLRTVSEDGEAVYDKDWEWLTWLGTSEFHHSLAMANLIDSSTTTDGWKAANRHDYSSGAGHTATQSVFWNTAGSGRLDSYQYGDGYIIGTTDVLVDTTVWDVLDSAGTSPEDYTEGLDEGETLNPQSLYEDQLARRLARGEGLW